MHGFAKFLKGRFTILQARLDALLRGRVFGARRCEKLDFDLKKCQASRLDRSLASGLY